MNVFDLQAKIGLDSKEYERGLNSARKKAATFAKVGIAAITAGTVAVTRGFVKATKATADYGDKVDKMSQKIGISAEAYQKWDYVMQRAGGNVDSLKMGMKTLSKQAESNSDAFQKLGISQEQVKNSSQEELFEATVKGLSKMEAGTERAALASQLLGRAGVDLGPLLNQGSKAIEEQMDIAERYGMIMPDAAVKASAAFKDSLTTLQMTFQGLRNRLMADFLPSITEVTDGLAKVFAGDMSGTEQIEKGINDFIDNIRKVLPEVIKIGESILEPLLNAVLNGLPKAMPTIIDLGVKIVTALVDALVQSAPLLIDGLFQIIKSTINALKEVDWSEVGKQFIDQLKSVFKESSGALIAVLTVFGLKLGKALLGGFGSALSGAGGLSGVLGKVTGGASAAGGGAGFLGDPARTAKGLGSVAIIIGGITAIVEAFGALNKIPGIKEFTAGGGDLLKEVFDAVGKIATPQTAGIFAAIEGMGALGPGMALSGLASFASLIGGLTLIVEAFGALDKIPGIEKFTKGGGDLLATVMEQIGRAIGAIVEGFAVEVTSGLPAIGENLAGFANAAKPFFDLCANADFSGMDGFASGLMALVGTDLINKIEKFFGSGLNFAEIGKQLSKFAEEMVPFFGTAEGIGDMSAGLNLMKAAGEISTLVGATRDWEKGWGEADIAGLGDALAKYAEKIGPFFTKAAEIGDTSKGVELMSISGKINKLVSAAKTKEQIGTKGMTDLAEALTGYAKGMAKYFETASGIGDMSAGLELVSKSGSINKLATTARDYKAGSIAKLGLDLVKFAANYKSFSENMEGSGEVDVSGAVSTINKLTSTAKSSGDALAKTVSGMGKGVSSAFSGIQKAFTSGGNSVAKAADFSSKIKTAMGKVSTAITSSKGSIRSSLNGVKKLFSDTKFKFNQSLKLPHFSMSGSFDAKTKKVPKVSVKWYAKAMDQPYLFDQPTFFGAGERGAEVLYGRDRLLGDIKDAVSGSSGDVIINLNYNASDDANDMMKDVVRIARRYKMAGAI